MLMNQVDDRGEHCRIGFGLHAMTEIENVSRMPSIVGEDRSRSGKRGFGSRKN